MAPKTDSQIKKDVLDELRWDTRVDETDVGVEVDRGVVTLTGTVDSWVKKLAAQYAAHRVSGVLDVADDIQVKVPGSRQRTDTDLAHAVRRALEWDALVPDDRIQSTIETGGVTLIGDVDYYSQRTDAERAIRNLTGVKWVDNRIVVRGPTIDPAIVRRAIEAALERHAERASKHVQLEIRDGTVILSGTARSWNERDAIVGAAGATPGVLTVEDHIRVQP